jgi:hypothetical protein
MCESELLRVWARVEKRFEYGVEEAAPRSSLERRELRRGVAAPGRRTSQTVGGRNFQEPRRRPKLGKHDSSEHMRRRRLRSRNCTSQSTSMTPTSSSESSSSPSILMSRSPPPTSSILVSSPSSRWRRPTSRVIWSLICERGAEGVDPMSMPVRVGCDSYARARTFWSVSARCANLTTV